MGKCNSFSQPGVGAKREATGRRPPGSAVESVGLGETTVWIWGCGRTRPGSSHRGPGEGAGGGSPVWSPGRRPPARERASDSLQSPRNLSALRMWQRCVEKGSAQAARSCSSPSGSPHPPLSRPPPLRPLHAPPASPFLGRGARPLASRSKLGTVSRSLWEETWGNWDWRQHPILGPGAQERPGQGVWIPGGKKKELARFGASPSGARREPAAVPGAKIAAWLEAENALGNCLQLGTRSGRGPRD